MIIYEIPGREDLEIKNIVFDYNGTIAKDGKLIEGVKELINSLAEKADIFILIWQLHILKLIILT